MAENFWLDKRVFISGASGFIGSHLYRILRSMGVIAGSLYLDNLRFVDVPFMGNLCKYDDVERAISRFRPEIVFHLAAQPLVDTALNAPLDTMETNVHGTYNLLEACRRVGGIKSFIHFSTDKVYGETTDELGTTENSTLSGVSHPYNASKLCADILAQSYSSFSDMSISIIRSGNIYGEGDIHYDRLIPYVCKMLVEGKDPILRSSGFLYRDYIYISDVIEALLLVGQYAKNGEIYNLGSEDTYTVKDIVGKLIKISGVSAVPVYKDNSHLELRYQHMNYAKIAKDFDWTPKVGIDEGLEKTYQWHKEMNQ